MIMEQQPQSVQTGQRLFCWDCLRSSASKRLHSRHGQQMVRVDQLADGRRRFPGTLYLTNRLYDGDQQALSWLRILACAVLGLLAVGLVLFLAGYVGPARLLPLM